MHVAKGQTAPEFTLPDATGTPWSLADHRGTPVVLYFYPRDDTRGCTAQACDVRDHWSEFEALGVPVAGISPDGVDSHAAFAAKYELPHTLLADTERTAIDAYGAWGTKSHNDKTYEAVTRTSVVLDAEGTVAAVFNEIDPRQQSSKALEVVRDLLS